MAKGFGVRPQVDSDTEWECYNMDTGAVVASNFTHSQAWREADKLNNEAKSRAENVSDWIWKKTLGG